MLGAGRKTAVALHGGDAGDGFEGADEYAAGVACGLTANVHAVVQPVNRIDVGVAGWAEKHLVAGRGAAVGVGGGVGVRIMGAEIGFDFDDAAGEGLGAIYWIVDEELAEQARGDDLGGGEKEGSRDAAAGERAFCG